MTWLMDGRRPTSVTAVTQQIKPDVYPRVDDEATIVVTYPDAQGIVQASWNWPFNRKDMEVYGRTGYALADDATHLRLRFEGETQTTEQAAPLAAPYDDAFAYLAAVVRGDVDPAGSLSSLAVNLVAMEILEAARPVESSQGFSQALIKMYQQRAAKGEAASWCTLKPSSRVSRCCSLRPVRISALTCVINSALTAPVRLHTFLPAVQDR